MYKIISNKKVRKDLKKLSKKDNIAIKNSINKKLVTNPVLYSKPLKNTLKGYRVLRVGKYRIVFKIIKKTVQVIGVSHRQTIYKDTLKLD